MTDKRSRDDMDGLEVFFTAARARAPEPSAEFLARVMAQAEALQPAPRGLARAVPDEAGAGGLMQALRGLFGGWAPMGGMITAAVAGVWIGFSGVAGVNTLTQSYLGGAESLGTVNLLPGGDSLAFAEGDDF